MQEAGRAVLSGFTLRVESSKPIRHPRHYSDPRGDVMWRKPGRYSVGLNSSDNIFADPEALQAYSDQLKRSLPPADKVKVIRAPARRRQLELQFYMFSKDVYQFIGKAGNSAAIVSVVLGALYEAYFAQL